jgi:hypothetical protein
MTGRIRDARGEIAARLEMLKPHPGLHQHDHQAIQNAPNNLRVLEREEKRLASDEKNRLLQETIQKLASVAPHVREANSTRKFKLRHRWSIRLTCTKFARLK